MSTTKSIINRNLKVLAIFFSMFQVAIIPLDIIITYLFTNIMDFVVSGKVDKTKEFAIFGFICIIIKLFVQLIGNSLFKKKISKRIHTCKVCILELLLDNPTHKLFCSDHGSITENLNDDLDSVVKLYTEAYPAIISSVIKIACFGSYLLFSNWIVCLSLVFISLLQLLPPLVVKKYLKENYDNCRNVESDITNHIIEAIDGFEVIKLYDLKYWWMNKMHHYHKEYLYVGKKTEATSTIQHSMYSMINNILTFGTYILLGLYTIWGICSLSNAWLGIYASRYLYDSVKVLSEKIPTIVIARTAENRLGVWDINDRLSSEEGAKSGSIKLQNVTLSYNNCCVFDDVNCEFDLNKKYLIKGSNGIGKTALFNLLSGLLLPTKGYVTIDEKQPRNFNSNVFPKNLFYIPQNIPDFNFDIKKIVETLRYNEYSTFIEILDRFEINYTSIAKKTFSELSGGERKKIVLSLAFSINPKIILLDEPSNSLDKTGIKVLRGLLNDKKGTVFIISHDNNYDNVVDLRCVVKDKGVYYEQQKFVEECL